MFKVRIAYHLPHSSSYYNTAFFIPPVTPSPIIFVILSIELVKRATKMQMSKTGGEVKMAFVPTVDSPCLVESDPDVLAQIITNMVSNAVKFTTSGAVQPFVWPAEALAPINDDDRDGVTDDVFSKATFLRSPYSLRRDLGGIEVMNSPQLGRSSSSESVESRDQSLGVGRRLAIGVVDTGPGLSAGKLKEAYNDLVSASTEVSRIDGLKNTGFGLHLSHILARAVGTRLHLASLAQVQNLCNNDVRSSVAEGRSGTGTVLYVEVPVSELRSTPNRSTSPSLPGLSTKAPAVEVSNPTDPHRNFKFCPKPIGDTFRILVSDDILMLRKGIVHTLAKVFTTTNCPVSIATACSAEESLRLVGSETFDLVILDNDFSQAAGIPLGKGQVRPRLVLDTDAVATDTPKSMSEKISSFFKNERFSVQEGDGVLMGYDAMKQLAEKPDGPLLMLLSGHTLSFPSHLGVMFAQKPLKQSELVPYLESKAAELVQSGRCRLELQKTDADDGCKISSENSNPVVVNRQGSQIFSSNPG
jgi:CheY-like chemotaxis protein